MLGVVQERVAVHDPGTGDVGPLQVDGVAVRAHGSGRMVESAARATLLDRQPPFAAASQYPSLSSVRSGAGRTHASERSRREGITSYPTIAIGIQERCEIRPSVARPDS